MWWDSARRWSWQWAKMGINYINVLLNNSPRWCGPSLCRTSQSAANSQLMSPHESQNYHISFKAEETAWKPSNTECFCWLLIACLDDHVQVEFATWDYHHHKKYHKFKNLMKYPVVFSEFTPLEIWTHWAHTYLLGSRRKEASRLVVAEFSSMTF